MRPRRPTARVGIAQIPQEFRPASAITTTDEIQKKVALFDIPQNTAIVQDMFVDPAQSQISFRAAPRRTRARRHHHLGRPVRGRRPACSCRVTRSTSWSDRADDADAGEAAGRTGDRSSRPCSTGRPRTCTRRCRSWPSARHRAARAGRSRPPRRARRPTAGADAGLITVQRAARGRPVDRLGPAGRRPLPVARRPRTTCRSPLPPIDPAAGDPPGRERPAHPVRSPGQPGLKGVPVNRPFSGNPGEGQPQVDAGLGGGGARRAVVAVVCSDQAVRARLAMQLGAGTARFAADRRARAPPWPATRWWSCSARPSTTPSSSRRPSSSSPPAVRWAPSWSPTSSPPTCSSGPCGPA